jgi:hypothetical protein
VVSSPERAELYAANAGHEFTDDNLDAVRNIASSTKEIGEGIGNKGVGFRSVEALTDDPWIYSCKRMASRRATLTVTESEILLFLSRLEIWPLRKL